MEKRIQRPGVRQGYDLWSQQYDHTPNPIVFMDRRRTITALNPKRGEWILDAGCGTGAHLGRIRDAGARGVGVDFSMGMLRMAYQSQPQVMLAQVDLEQGMPFPAQTFDAVLCALVSEHLTHLSVLFREAFAVLQPGGRLVFSAFHTELAAAGVEANFEHQQVEYRLGAELHEIDDYVQEVARAGFQNVRIREFEGDSQLVEEVPDAGKYMGRKLMLILEAERPSQDEE